VDTFTTETKTEAVVSTDESNQSDDSQVLLPETDALSGLEVSKEVVDLLERIKHDSRQAPFPLDPLITDDGSGVRPPAGNELYAPHDDSEGWTPPDRAALWAIFLALDHCLFDRHQHMVYFTGVPPEAGLLILEHLGKACAQSWNVPGKEAARQLDFLKLGSKLTNVRMKVIWAWKTKTLRCDVVSARVVDYAAELNAMTGARSRGLILIIGIQNIRGLKPFLHFLGTEDFGNVSIVSIATNGALGEDANPPQTFADTATMFRCAWNEGRLWNKVYSPIENWLNPRVNADNHVVMVARWGHCLWEDEKIVARDIFDLILRTGIRPEAALRSIIHTANGSINAMFALTWRLELEMTVRDRNFRRNVDRFIDRLTRYARLSILDSSLIYRHAVMKRGVEVHYTLFLEELSLF
jgi:hypothetical protein